ncbi:hypothetical protein [Frateuria aurantia]|uniref:Uncharacterized protein n=1 Tax=Frateuria aurantia (strain ATCC 33424 / DSM 6220 / KCTC 2777 / LMG 1558 / NBRC 3245 / NCIMB 13370) TaxID=767434 RepID=H8L026_FRAAD|nr:hypothetical protein [Frateuria aurantia]AFC86238.1 hypothetical protein Fraau_1835 [Frateuria aurantia DSM 6220]
MSTPTIPYEQIKDELVEAFDFFNRELFDGAVPRCMISYSPCRGRNGHYARKNLLYAPAPEGEALQVDEISLNPNMIVLRPLQATLSTMVHQMARAWRGRIKDEEVRLQALDAHRDPPRHWLDELEKDDDEAGPDEEAVLDLDDEPAMRSYVDDGYHDRLLADQMIRIGLLPCAEGIPGQRQTGRRIGHAIIIGGAFDQACGKLLATGFAFSWIGRRIAALPDPGHLPMPADLGLKEAAPQYWSPDDTELMPARQRAQGSRREALNVVRRQAGKAFSQQGVPEERYNRVVHHLDVSSSVKGPSSRHRKQCPGCRKICSAPADFELICTTCRRPLVDLDPDSSPRLRRLRDVQRYEIGPLQENGEVSLKRIDPDRRGRPRKS